MKDLLIKFKVLNRLTEMYVGTIDLTISRYITLLIVSTSKELRHVTCTKKTT